MAQAGRIRAPELTEGVAWFNTDRPITLAELRGHVVLLDFWTSCCINCRHLVPDLEAMEEKYRAAPFQVIGVHSAKFEDEAQPSAIEQAVRRWGIHHPVVVDKSFRIWNAYGVRAWPTLVLVDADGRIAGMGSGEPDRDTLGRAIAALLAEAQDSGAMVKPRIAAPPPLPPDPGPLAFPGKVLATEDGRLFVADTNHHRILIADAKGQVTDVIGSGLGGAEDGAFGDARLLYPQGLALVVDAGGESLWIADTGNHRIRRADLGARRVETAAGSGRKGTGVGAEIPADPREADLRSPWGLCEVGGILYAAMAGAHQIWALDLAARRLSVFSGSGREDLINGAAGEAAFAQPSGLATDGTSLYVADSESSAIRIVSLPGGEVSTLAGAGLFEFGDRDGSVAQARLQHPVDVACGPDAVYICDSFNSKIRKIALGTRIVSTVWGARNRHDLDEPGGVSFARGKLYVADTNHHRVIERHLATGSHAPLVLRGIPPASVARAQVPAARPTAGPERIRLPAYPARGGVAVLRFRLEWPDGARAAQASAVRVEATVLDSAGRPLPLHRAVSTSPGDARDLAVSAWTMSPEAREVSVEISLTACTTADGICYPVDMRLTVPLEAGARTPEAPAPLTILLPG